MSPSRPPSLLSLPDDALCCILFLLGSAPSGHVSPLIPSQTNLAGSAAAALAATCPRLAKLHCAHVVRCVDVSRGPCCCGLATVLDAYPKADAVVLGELHNDHAGADLWRDAGDMLGRVNALCLHVVPSDAFADALVAAMPGLRNFEVANGNWGERKKRQPGMARLLRQLPSGLRRVRVSYLAEDMLAQDALWTCLGHLVNLQELVLKVYTLAPNVMESVRRCHNLRRLAISTCWWSASLIQLTSFIEQLPSGLKALQLADEDGYQSPHYYLEDDAFARFWSMEALEMIGVEIEKWVVLLSVAPRLRRLVLSNVAGYSEAQSVMKVMGRLEDLCLTMFDRGRGWGCRQIDDLVMAVFAGRRLRRVCISSMPVNDCILSMAVLSANCGRSLRELELVGCEQIGDAAALAIGECFTCLEKLKLEMTNVSPTGLSNLGRGCVHLSDVSVEGCSNIGDAGATTIGKTFSRLNKLNITGCVGVSAGGVDAIVLGCPRLTKLLVDSSVIPSTCSSKGYVGRLREINPKISVFW